MATNRIRSDRSEETEDVADAEAAAEAEAETEICFEHLRWVRFVEIPKLGLISFVCYK